MAVQALLGQSRDGAVRRQAEVAGLAGLDAPNKELASLRPGKGTDKTLVPPPIASPQSKLKMEPSPAPKVSCP